MKKTFLLLIISLFSLCAFSQNSNEKNSWLAWIDNNLPVVAEFTEWQTSTSELPPDFAAMPTSNLLPDPFIFYNGSKVSQNREGWKTRRAEIWKLFERYVTGTFPPKPDKLGKVEILDETRGIGYSEKNLRVLFGPDNRASVRIRLVIPDGKEGEKFPVLISPNLQGWASQLVRRGYISAGYAGNDFMDDAAALKDIYPDYDFATLPRRAWLAQIVIDYLATVPQVDMRHIAIFGYSRDGKMATYAAALDERISAVIAGSTGVGGVVPWRYAGERGGGEGIESTTRMFPSWFVPRMRYFSGKEDKLPVDANLLIALVAPRAALLEWGLNDQVANGWAMEQACESAGKVYDLFDARNKLQLMHIPGFHGSNDQDACVDFLDIQFGKSNKKWHYEPIFRWNFEEWKKLSGEKIDIVNYSEKKPLTKKEITKNFKNWENDKASILKTINYFLGVKPPVYKENPQNAAPRRAGRGGFATPNIFTVAEGKAGNPGQLRPDVPAWVMGQTSPEYGWLPADRGNVDAKRITFSGITGDLYFPKNTPEGAKLKTVIWLHGYSYPLGYMQVYRREAHPALALVNAGYAVLAFDQTGFGMRFGESADFYDRYTHWSRMGKMVEDVSAAIDALENEEMVNKDKIAVFGLTMGGSVALYAAALDSRIQSVVSICGFTPMRSDVAEKGLSGMARYSHLYGLIPRLGFFTGNEKLLPYDFDDIISTIAPRPVLVVQPDMDRDVCTADVKKAVEQASLIYENYKAKDKLALQTPNDYGRLSTPTQNAAIEWLKGNF